MALRPIEHAFVAALTVFVIYGLAATEVVAVPIPHRDRAAQLLQVCGIYPFHRKRMASDHYGVNVFWLDEFDPSGTPVRATVGAGVP